MKVQHFGRWPSTNTIFTNIQHSFNRHANIYLLVQYGAETHHTTKQYSIVDIVQRKTGVPFSEMGGMHMGGNIPE